VQMWQLIPGIPLAHQGLPLPIYQTLVELENQLFSGEVLYNKMFEQIKTRLVLQYRCYPCQLCRSHRLNSHIGG
jgi:hypothetical protein